MTEQLQILLSELMDAEEIIQMTFSNPRHKTADSYSLVRVKPILLKQQLHYQFTYQYKQKVTHENALPQAALAQCLVFVMEQFKQGWIQSARGDVQILVNSKGKLTLLRKAATPNAKQANPPLTHNRGKNYVLEEGTPVPFLVELGVMNKEGKVLAAKYDKFRQINRFLEMIADIVPALPQGRRLNIVDFGCGKSYLTFALHHYLRDKQGMDLRVIGLDLKADVIAHCNDLARRLQLDDLTFLVGDISQYVGLDQVDMVVTLHACDTATDAALEKAIRWGASVILSVPCCQHELFRQVKQTALSPLLKHGIMKERFAALATDSARAALLTAMGYRTQILEFIDLEHTPKNLLIRAVRPSASQEAGMQERRRAYEDYLEFKRFLEIDPYLERALQDKLKEIGDTR